MAEETSRESVPAKTLTRVERRSDRELVATRIFDAPARLVFEAWTKAELFRQWWVPKSAGMALVSCEMDVRVGGGYRLEFGIGEGRTMAFFGKYLEVTPPTRLSWTNEESPEGAISTVILQEKDGRTLLEMHEVYPSREACENSAGGMEEGIPESFDQLAEFLAARA